jgi:hypothetical protein
MLAVLNGLADSRHRLRSRRILLAAVRAGAPRLLLDAVLHHANWRVRTQSARLLAESQDPEVLRLLRFYATDAQRPREQVILAWLERRLQETAPATIEPPFAYRPEAQKTSQPLAQRESGSPAAGVSLAREKR